MNVEEIGLQKCFNDWCRKSQRSSPDWQEKETNIIVIARSERASEGKKQKWKHNLMINSAYAYEEYKRERLKTKKLVTKAKQKDILENLRQEKEQPSVGVEYKEGELLDKEEHINRRWKEYLMVLLEGEEDNKEGKYGGDIEDEDGQITSRNEVLEEQLTNEE
ncbi:hypothetical protein HHI36_000288 [Cryptolaemus montrouzieri]|uniref:Uncharacterized protein n=1 Tax=Cryptolaemus montrouzieri TaxID=559131 RepID=A0ABD2P4V2_9CUCU